MNLTFYWIQYVVLAAVILNCGSRLVRDGEIIADRTKLGGTLVGILLLSIVTSLPELFNGAGSVLFAKEPDLTVGDIVGSLLINLVIFAGVTFFIKKGKWETLGTPSLVLSGIFSILLTFVSPIYNKIQTPSKINNFALFYHLNTAIIKNLY